MPYICYTPKHYTDKNQAVIDQANAIIADYTAQGFRLTIRQLYYRFVARDLLPNTMQSYNRLVSIMTDARLSGDVDWNAIEDRTRQLRGTPHWDSPADSLHDAQRTYAIDKWAGQKYRPEIWIEKDALAGVFERVCTELDVDYFSCRGYTSASEMWVASQQHMQYIDNGQIPVIIHFGDHDPSGMDMSRDIADRMGIFLHQDGVPYHVNRVALNTDQVRKYRPPPNPAKMTDSRYAEYVKLYGKKSWELDALDPSVLMDLARAAVLAVRNDKQFKAKETQEQEERLLLCQITNDVQLGDITLRPQPKPKKVRKPRKPRKGKRGQT